MDALRKRIQRRTILHERDDNRRVWVLLDASSTVPDDEQVNLIDELHEQLRYLCETLNEERDACERVDTMVAQPTRTNAAHVLELEASPGELAPPPRLPAGARGDSESRKEPKWRRLLEG